MTIPTENEKLLNSIQMCVCYDNQLTVKINSRNDHVGVGGSLCTLWVHKRVNFTCDMNKNWNQHITVNRVVAGEVCVRQSFSAWMNATAVSRVNFIIFCRKEKTVWIWMFLLW